MEKISFFRKSRFCVKKPAGALVAIVVMLSAAFCDPATVTKAVCDFQDEAQTVTQAAALPRECSALMMTEVSWLEWASGKSTSYQFHFFDLLELLYGNSDRDFQPAGK